MNHWFEHEDMWRIFYDCMFDEDSFIRAGKECKNILKLCATPVTSVLDLGCGPGRHIMCFARAGLSVTGVVLSAYLLNQAAHHVEQENLDATLVQADLLAYAPQQQFDLITNLFSSFGYYDDSKDNQKILHHAFQWLKPAGCFVLDVFSKEQAAMHIEPVHCTEYDNGDVRFERPLLTDNLSVYSNEWILVRGNRAYRWAYQHYVYSACELTTMLKRAGFSDIQVYGSFEGTDYDMAAERLVMVAHKP